MVNRKKDRKPKTIDQDAVLDALQRGFEAGVKSARTLDADADVDDDEENDDGDDDEEAEE